MTEHEWEACQYPDLMLEDLVGTMSREQLVDFVRRCWERMTVIGISSAACSAHDEIAIHNGTNHLAIPPLCVPFEDTFPFT